MNELTVDDVNSFEEEFQQYVQKEHLPGLRAICAAASAWVEIAPNLLYANGKPVGIFQPDTQDEVPPETPEREKQFQAVKNDLIEQLRAFDEELLNSQPWTCEQTAKEAAEALGKCRDALAQCRAQNEGLHNNALSLRNEVERLKNRSAVTSLPTLEDNEALSTEVERLKVEAQCDKEYLDNVRARVAALEGALEASIAANELVLAQLRGGQDLSEGQVTRTMNAALTTARAALTDESVILSPQRDTEK